ncbi:MAG: YfhO family protein, partial [Ruminococcus sp.]|nr:YfhO family protein [Ruminococcus sp.]
MDNKTNKLKALSNNKTLKFLYEKGIIYGILSFLIPVCIMLYAFYRQKIHPFGDEQMLVVDLWHQYFPFFRVEREKLLTGGSFLYSWQNGMGTNFLALIAYYAASPLNWISIFFNEDSVRDALTYILIAKVGFSGLFCNIFLRYTYRHKDISTVFFGCMFALCSYTLGYYWNVMWFDTVALFPLVMTGITAICRERKWKLYTIALALSLISNYYVGYFTCLFTVFMFLCTVINEAKGIKDGFYKLWLIFRSSLMGAGLGAFILLPAYYGLQLTYSVNNTFPKTVSWAEKWQDIFANLISYNEPTHLEGLPNFACGMLAVMLFGVFLFSGGIKIREKISGIFLLALIAVSCNMNMLNFIWHGFHTTNQLPYRYSFIFSFVLVSLAYRAFDAMTEKGIKIYQIFLLLPAPCAVVFMNYLSNGKEFKFEVALKSTLIMSAAYLLIFVAVKIFPFKDYKIRRACINFILIFAVVGELGSNAVTGVKAVGSSSYSAYPTKNEDVQKILSEIRETDSSPFYRTEMTYTYTLNDSALYGYTGVSQFSSSANVSVSRLFRRLGLFASEAGNRYYYRISTPFVNSLLGIKYLISKNGQLNTENAFLEYQDTSGSTSCYENKYALPFGFMMNEKILELEDSDADNPFEYQNKIYRLALDTDEKLYTPQPVALVKYDGMNVTKNNFGNYS